MTKNSQQVIEEIAENMRYSRLSEHDDFLVRIVSWSGKDVNQGYM